MAQVYSHRPQLIEDDFGLMPTFKVLDLSISEIYQFEGACAGEMSGYLSHVIREIPLRHSVGEVQISYSTRAILRQSDFSSLTKEIERRFKAAMKSLQLVAKVDDVDDAGKGAFNLL